MYLNQDDNGIVGGHYQIDHELGRGSFGITYLARDRHKLPPHNLVALKQISVTQPENVGERSSSYLENLEREARVLSTLKHDRIPQFLGRFDENDHFYIVQEYVAGNNLSGEINAGNKLSEAEAIAMLADILEVLKFVHARNIVHRDIKPANLIRRSSDNKIVLIDFGAVKEITTQHTNSSGATVTKIIGTLAYMPPEQAIGNPQFNSDIYALGITILQGLTGFSSEDICHAEREPLVDSHGNYLWEHAATEISDGLKEIISKMIQYCYGDRYQSAGDILQALQELGPIGMDPIGIDPIIDPIDIDDGQKSMRWNNFKRILIITSSLLAISVITAYWQRTNLLSLLKPACNSQIGDYMSCGEEILYPASKSNERKKANQAFKAGDYENALDYYRSSWEQDGADAETLIYMNNALLEASNADYYTLAIAAPLSYKKGTVAKNYELGQDYLRGVAQAQTEINLGLKEAAQASQFNLPGESFLELGRISTQKPKGLKIVVVDDRNSEAESRKMAPSIVAKPRILGLIGHHASNVTLGAVDIYEKAQLPEVSFTTTTSDLSDHPRKNFFRVAYTSLEEAKATSSVLNKLAIRDKKIAIFGNPGSDYSNNLRFKLKEIIKGQNIEIVKEFNLADDRNFSISLALQEAKNKGANILILLPDGQETNALSKAMELIAADNGNTVILAGNPLVNSKTEEIITDQPIQLIATTFWDPLVDPEGAFTKTSQQLWGTGVNGNMAMAYDATLAFIEAIKLQPNNPTRKSVLKQLSTLGFIFDGATGQDIKLNTPTNGDRLDFAPTLVKLLPCKNGDRFYEFVPIKYLDAKAAGLSCS